MADTPKAAAIKIRTDIRAAAKQPISAILGKKG